MPEELFTIPESVADHFELDGAAYADGKLEVQGTAKVPVAEAYGQDVADVLDLIAKADDDRVFTKREAKAIAIKVALAVAKHQGLGKLLS